MYYGSINFIIKLTKLLNLLQFKNLYILDYKNNKGCLYFIKELLNHKYYLG
jgi:hypothetical protein